MIKLSSDTIEEIWEVQDNVSGKKPLLYPIWDSYTSNSVDATYLSYEIWVGLVPSAGEWGHSKINETNQDIQDIQYNLRWMFLHSS